MSKTRHHSDHQLTLKKLNDFNKELDSINEGLIKFAQNLDFRFQVMEITLDKMLLESNLEEVNFEDFTLEEFNEKYARLFYNYFVKLETDKIVLVKFPEKPKDGLLDDSK